MRTYCHAVLFLALCLAAGAAGEPQTNRQYETSLHESPYHRPGITALAFSPDGKSLAVGVSRGIIRIWDIEAKQFSKTLRLDDRPADTLRVAAIQAASVFGDPKKTVKSCPS